MSSEIMLRDAAAPADPDSDLLLRHENTVNTPVISATFPRNGKAVCGVYTVVAASGSTIDISAEDPKNELIGTGVAVVADDATGNDLGFANVVFSSSLATGWTAKFSVGALMDATGATSRRLNVGVSQSGVISTQRRVTAVNVGTEDSAESAVHAYPGYRLEGPDVEDYVLTLKNHTDAARAGLAIAGTKILTFGDYKVGPPETADLYVNAVKTIEDAELNNTLYQYGVDGYIDAADGLKGLAIAFQDTPGDPTSKTFYIYVRDSSGWMEFAPDVTGAPGTWQSGPMTLTESGQVSGVITAAGSVNFWVRVNIPESAEPGDMRLHNYRVSGLTV